MGAWQCIHPFHSELRSAGSSNLRQQWDVWPSLNHPSGPVYDPMSRINIRKLCHTPRQPELRSRSIQTIGLDSVPGSNGWFGIIIVTPAMAPWFCECSCYQRHHSASNGDGLVSTSGSHTAMHRTLENPNLDSSAYIVTMLCTRPRTVFNTIP